MVPRLFPITFCRTATFCIDTARHFVKNSQHTRSIMRLVWALHILCMGFNKPCTDRSVLLLKTVAISFHCKNVSSAYTARRVVNGILWVSTENKNNSYRSLMEVQSPNCKNVKLLTCQINIFSYLCKLLCAYPYIAHNYNTLSINNSHSNGDEIQSD